MRLGTKQLPGIVVITAVTLVTVACGTTRRSEPLVGPFAPASAEVARGQRVFMAQCHACHPGGEAGIGPSLNDKPLPGFMIALQVRAGLGAMPAFSTEEIPARDLDGLVAYVIARRRM